MVSRQIEHSASGEMSSTLGVLRPRLMAPTPEGGENADREFRGLRGMHYAIIHINPVHT